MIENLDNDENDFYEPAQNRGLSPPALVVQESKILEPDIPDLSPTDHVKFYCVLLIVNGIKLVLTYILQNNILV